MDLKGDAPKCSCPDHEINQKKCKHIFAAEFSVRRETSPDGTTTVTKTMRVTYTQDWTAYNTAQTREKSAWPNCCAVSAMALRSRHRRWDGLGCPSLT